MRFAKLISLALALVTLFASSSCSPKENFTAKGTESQHVDETGSYTFVSNGDGTCDLRKYGYGEYTNTVINIPKTSPDGDRVVKISYGSIASGENIETIIIPDSVEVIEIPTFRKAYFPKLSFNEAEGIKYLGSDENPYLAAVACDDKLKQAVIQPSTKVMTGTFTGNKELESVTFSDSTVYIGEQVFSGCEKLREAVLPQSVTKIDSYAFKGCTALERVILPDKVTSIGVNAFQNCSSLRELRMSEGILEVSADAFKGCGKLEYNEYEGVKYLGNEKNPYTVAADESGNNKSVVLHKDTTVIADGAFLGSKMSSIELPAGLKTIGSSAFEKCTWLSEVEVPDGVLKIYSNAFFGCVTVTLPQSLKYISPTAFGSSPTVDEIIFKGTIEQWASIEGADGLQENLRLVACKVTCSDGIVE